MNLMTLKALNVLNNVVNQSGKLLGFRSKINDSMKVGIVSGLLGTIAMDLVNLVMWKTNKSEGLFGHLSASMLMRSFRTNQRKNFWLGQFFHLVTGAGVGVVMTEAFKRYGKDKHLFKGAFMGMFIWGFLYNFGQRVELFSRKFHLTKTHYTYVLNNIIYGLITSQLIVSLADPVIFKQKSISREDSKDDTIIFKPQQESNSNTTTEDKVWEPSPDLTPENTTMH